MTLLEALKQEFEQEMQTTRKMLSRVPDDKFSWKPHEKSMELKSLSMHIADLPTWIPMAMNTEELDFAAAPYDPKTVNSTNELLEVFESSVEQGRQALQTADEKKFGERWLLRTGDNIHLETTRYGLIRISLSQIIHHRAQLGVYLRLLNIPIPGSYGPSADEQSF
ncbi:MAG: DinB family protein [Chitinophagaceae bacterium]|nr:MAG: DinB family protein [Chitinophagaceae bacterium]